MAWSQQAREAAAAARAAKGITNGPHTAYRVRMGTAKQTSGAPAHSRAIFALPSILAGLVAGGAGIVAKMATRGR
jgi:hypothetical protein